MQVGDKVTYIFPGDAKITALHERNSGPVADIVLQDEDGDWPIKDVGVESLKAWDGTFNDDQWIGDKELRDLLKGNPWRPDNN